MASVPVLGDHPRVETTLVGGGLVVVAAVLLWGVVRYRSTRGFSSPEQRLTFDALHAASQAAPPLRIGLTEASAAKSIRYLRQLLGTPALAITSLDKVLAWEGIGAHHRDTVMSLAAGVLESARPAVAKAPELTCAQPDCPLRGAVIAPVTLEDGVAGALVALTWQEPGAGLVRATLETARWVGTQLELAELDQSRARLARAEIRALRAQISPHFIYNALGAIASFVRTDPDRARELLLEFAEFTRYSFRQYGEFTTLAEELGNIERYLLIERARFGERLEVTLRIAPEVLPVAVPFLTLQPLVENAVRHGLAGKPGIGTISIRAEDAGAQCLITVEDDGVGMDPARLRELTAVDGDGREHVGLGNVDDRLRSVFGDDYGLVVETAPGAGTKVSLRIPKFHAGVRAG